jgi:hypothetical protein
VKNSASPCQGERAIAACRGRRRSGSRSRCRCGRF